MRGSMSELISPEDEFELALQKYVSAVLEYKVALQRYTENATPEQCARVHEQALNRVCHASTLPVIITPPEEIQRRAKMANPMVDSDPVEQQGLYMVETAEQADRHRYGENALTILRREGLV
jgi:hypothetical protein